MTLLLIEQFIEPLNETRKKTITHLVWYREYGAHREEKTSQFYSDAQKYGIWCSCWDLHGQKSMIFINV